jgi:hypothetical protein
VLRRALEACDKLRADIFEWRKGKLSCAMAWRDGDCESGEVLLYVRATLVVTSWRVLGVARANAEPHGRAGAATQ